MAGYDAAALLELVKPREKVQGMRVVTVVTTEPNEYTFVFEGDKVAVDMALFEMPVTMYPLRKGDRLLAFPLIDTETSQRWAVVEKITGGVTLATMTSGSTLQVAGIDKEYGAEELILPPYFSVSDAYGMDSRDPHTYLLISDIRPLQAGDMVSLSPTIVNGKIKYVVLERYAST